MPQPFDPNYNPYYYSRGTAPTQWSDIDSRRQSDVSRAPLGPMSEEEARGYRFGRQDITPGMSEEERYQARFGQLVGMARGADQMFEAERARQTGAVQALGQRAATMQQSAALANLRANEDMMQRQAAAAPQAVLSGAIGQQTGRGLGAIEQEAAQRQAAYVRGLQSLGAGLMSEAEQRRAIENEIQRDLQVRFAAAQQLAAGQAQQQREEGRGALGRWFGAGGAILGGLLGGPLGAAVGYGVGSKAGGGS